MVKENSLDLSHYFLMFIAGLFWTSAITKHKKSLIKNFRYKIELIMKGS